MAKDIIIKKSDLYKNGYYKEDSLDVNVNIKSETNLGIIKFKKGVETTKGIYLGNGCGIKTGEDIKARGSIKAGKDIEAGWHIEAGGFIEADGGIKTDGGIKAGLSIVCKKELSFKYQLFAGVCTWRKLEDDDLIVKCGKLNAPEGKIITGNLIETSIKEEQKEIIIDGKTIKISKESFEELKKQFCG